MNPKALVALILAGLVVIGLVRFLGEPDGEPSGEVSTVDHVARARAATHFEDGKYADARRELAPLVERKSATLQDLLSAAAVEFHDVKYETAAAFLDRIEATAPRFPGSHYIRGCMARAKGDYEAAERSFRIAHEEAPNDLPSTISLAMVISEMGETDEQFEENLAEAEELLRSVLEVGVDFGGSWYVTAAYRLHRISIEQQRDPEVTQRYNDLWGQLSAQNYKSVTEQDLDKGTFAVVPTPPTKGSVVAELAAEPRFAPEPAFLPELAGATVLLLLDVDGNRAPDVVSGGPFGLRVVVRKDGSDTVQTLHGEPVGLLKGIDLANDDHLDFVITSGDELLIYEWRNTDQGSVEWALSPTPLPPLPGLPDDLEVVDFDHDGDLDLLIVGAFGARVFRNDGVAEVIDGERLSGAWVDASLEAALPDDRAFTWCIVEDFDSDQDVDLMFGGPSGVVLADSLRRGRFADVTAEVFGENAAFNSKPVVADFDGDSRPDFFVAGSGGSTFWWRGSDGKAVPSSSQWVVPAGRQVHAMDIDLDGALDIAWAGSGAAIEGVRAFASPVGARFEVAGEVSPGPIAFADLDGDQEQGPRDLDILRSTANGLEVFRCIGGTGNAVRLELIGLKDNRRGVGAVVEMRSWDTYRRIYWTGAPQLLGFGKGESLDILRVSWPNGVVDNLLDIGPGKEPVTGDFGGLRQPEGLVGSCPFLYTWNGKTYEFISDVLGITPLGLPMAPGRLVPPDHDEYVLVRGDQLEARDGVLEMQFTEELREVTYLDRVRLDVIDHPEGTRVYPDERFTFPPFPEPHTHTVREPLSPSKVTGSDGNDWTQELAHLDDVHAVPFELQKSQFLGLAKPHWIELEFDKERIAGAEKLRLIFTGWFYWTDASVNMASARTPGLDFIPPILQVPNEEGVFVPVGPPVGFPAGKTKSMVIDVTDILRREDPRIRVFSTLRLYWDEIVLATDADDAPLVVQALEPVSAKLWRRGFSEPVTHDDPTLPERFDWDRLSKSSRWNQHPGKYTRLGEALPLVQAIDDRFVVMGSGDALTVRFDAAGLAPPPEGYIRDYLVFLDGWAKDRDPNTIEALNVEPLPFHGMSGYPYRLDEAFPGDEEHEAWRRDWQTRSAYEAIVPIAPKRETEWVLER